jgi:hypothetical protein
MHPRLFNLNPNLTIRIQITHKIQIQGNITKPLLSLASSLDESKCSIQINDSIMPQPQPVIRDEYPRPACVENRAHKNPAEVAEIFKPRRGIRPHRRPGLPLCNQFFFSPCLLYKRQLASAVLN